MTKSFSCDVAGRTLTFETGKLAGQANGSVTVRYGDTVVLVTACTGEAREGKDFFPLTIDYEERLYAAGKIPGGFLRRETRPSDESILTMRMTDRPLRPLFPKEWRNEVQVIVTVLSADQENIPDILSIIGASAALSVSDIPFEGPVSAVHVGYIDGKLVVNPPLAQLSTADLDMVIAGTSEAVIMIEAGAREISNSLVMEAITLGQEANRAIIETQRQLRQECGKSKLNIVSKHNSNLESAISSYNVQNKLDQIIANPDKTAREFQLEEFKTELIEKLRDRFHEGDVSSALDSILQLRIRSMILEKKCRLDGRSFRDVRPLSCEVGLLPRTHGSGLFQRGQTQVLTITTLGSAGQEQKLDGLGIEETKRFMHHYNFPPFSNGEVKRLGGRSRREVGHGALVERALQAVIPDNSAFPYTIRLVSEVLSSNGSTSQASVCASTLSLMDAGIPIKAPVAGIAMGLITGEDGKYGVLTDIEGLEDHHGDMDFKVAGTSQGITALQLDTKLTGVDIKILEEALHQADEARLQILDVMNSTIASSRTKLSPYAPRIYKVAIDPSKIGTVIGPGGKTIRAIVEQTKATINVDNDGTVLIGSNNEEAAQKAISIIEGLTKEVEVGGVYTGKVTRLLNFGAMVEIIPGKEGLVHISELADYRVPSVEDIANVGDEMMVKVIEIDRLGRINLSRRAVFGESSNASEAGVKEPMANSDSANRPSTNPDRRPYHGNRDRRY